MAAIKYKDPQTGEYKTVVGLNVKQYVRAPRYDAENKRMTFPAEAKFQYDAENKRIILSGNS